MSKEKKKAESIAEATEAPNNETGMSEAEAGKDSEVSKEIDVLKKQLDEALSQSAEYKDGWQRAVADFTNYKRRVETERVQMYQMAVGDVVKRYLPILDDIERALRDKPGDPWADGIELVYRKLQSTLEASGLKRMEAEGQMFDPNFHEAISQEPSDSHECGQIIEVVQQGYMLGERVIRPAMVRVAA